MGDYPIVMKIVEFDLLTHGFPYQLLERLTPEEVWGYEIILNEIQKKQSEVK